MNESPGDVPQPFQAMFHVVDSLAVGGAERMAVDIANGLARRGWQIHVVATRSSGSLAAQLGDRIRVHELNRTSRFDLRGMWRFRELVRHHRPAVVHAHGWSSLQFATAVLVTVPRGPKLVFHDHRSAGLTSVGWSYRAAAWPLVHAWIAVDEALLEQAPSTRCHCIRVLIPNGSPLDRFHRKRVYDSHVPPRLVMVANMRPEKAHPVFFDALAVLATRGLAVQADLLGATDDPAHLELCRARLATTGLQEAVTIAGTCNDVGSALAGYDLGVLTSMSESGPVALIEYLAAGLPFVVTDVGNVARSLPTGLRRWVVEPGDPVALADLIQEALCRTPDERCADADEGRRFVHDALSIDRTVDGVEAVYRRLLSP